MVVFNDFRLKASQGDSKKSWQSLIIFNYHDQSLIMHNFNGQSQIMADHENQIMKIHRSYLKNSYHRMIYRGQNYSLLISVKVHWSDPFDGIRP